MTEKSCTSLIFCYRGSWLTQLLIPPPLCVFRAFILTFTMFCQLWFNFFILCENTFVFILYYSDLRLYPFSLSWSFSLWTFSVRLWVPGVFLESPGNYSGPESCFVFVAFTFKIKVLIILKIREWNYQLTKQNWLVYGPGTVLLFSRFGFHCLRARKVFGPFGKPAPGAILSQSGISLRVSKCRSSYPACTRLFFRLITLYIALC